MTMCEWDYLNGRKLQISNDCFCLHSISQWITTTTTKTAPDKQTGKYAFNGNNLGEHLQVYSTLFSAPLSPAIWNGTAAFSPFKCVCVLVALPSKQQVLERF